MELIGRLIKRAFELRNLPQKVKKANRKPVKEQERVLKKLLIKAQFTIFGEDYNFYKILSSKNIIENFRKNVPIFDYKSMYKRYWYRLLNGESFVCWPSHVKYFALSSGTSEASSKYIPVTRSMIKSIKRASIRQLVSMVNYKFPLEFYNKGMLMIGGSTHLNYNGKYYAGDLSGITANKIPFWFQHWYKPGKTISQSSDWNLKLEEIVNAAPSWDIGVIVGVPAWVQIIFEKIIERYNLKNIHEMWPNLNIYVHSGVSIKPYLKTFNKLFGKKIFYIESYLASEGYIAYKTDPDALGMELITNNGIYFEFVPFTPENFDEEANIRSNASTYWLKEVENNIEYALLISTNAGAWRYLIGDTIIFTDKDKSEIQITGRTKQFLSVCGEHLSLENLSRAVEILQDKLNIEICEFTVFAQPHKNLFEHIWYLGSNDKIDNNLAAKIIDAELSTLNDDYRVERMEAIKLVKVESISCEIFYKFMEKNNKLGGANKFPRVLKGERIQEWQNFLEEQSIKSKN
ncbi:MAG: GH3 auxin-responsive promoter [Bacteroidetes bacterium CG2_30_33_31]|nr:MAG: GH3 auxin-responsive promoter [Bacteroidetes bacterium CG2_30_33_31]